MRAHVAVMLAVATLSASAPSRTAFAQAPTSAPAAAAAAEKPSAEKLAAARKAFAEGMKDEQDRRFGEALEKFRQVQAVKSTLAVRYRIASCLEGLGRLREAQREFRALADERVVDPGDGDIRESARERAVAIEQRMPHLTLHLSPRAPADAVVTLDAQPLVGGALRGEPIPVDPGEHEVRANGSGAPPFTSRVTLAEQGTVSLDVPLDPVSAPPPPPPPVQPRPEASASRTLGIVLVSVGGALAVATVVTLLLRQGEISGLNKSCPGGVCPASRESELTSARSRALTEGPLAAVLAGAAVAAGGAGVYFLLAPSPPAPQSTAATLHGLTLGVRGAF